MNGIEFLRKLMPQYPLPVVVISALSDKVFDAMNAGAVDFVGKPAITNRMQLEDFIRNELLVPRTLAARQSGKVTCLWRSERRQAVRRRFLK